MIVILRGLRPAESFFYQRFLSPEKDHRTCNKNRRVCPNDNTHEHRKSKVMYDLTTEKEKRQGTHKHGHRGNNGPGEDFVDTYVHNRSNRVL